MHLITVIGRLPVTDQQMSVEAEILMMSKAKNRLGHRDWRKSSPQCNAGSHRADKEVKNVVDAIEASGCEPHTSVAG